MGTGIHSSLLAARHTGDFQQLREGTRSLWDVHMLRC